VTKTLGSARLGPVDTDLVIIINDSHIRHKDMFYFKKVKNLSKFQEEFHAFISGINLCLSRTTSSNSLSLGNPM
jgi:hypothetical protein